VHAMAVEAELLRRCRAGDTRAYEPIVRSYEGAALRIAAALLGDEDDARDAVQDAFVRAFGALDRFDPERPFLPWLLAIVRNRSRDLLRARRPSVGLEVLDGPVGGAGAAQHADPAERGAARELVWRALAQVAPEHREVLVLKELEGFSYAEIARTAGIPAGTVASRLYHARQALRSVLEAARAADARLEARP
jgi:RNA polymerase sigma-70 factor, ECF subfamily